MRETEGDNIVQFMHPSKELCFRSDLATRAEVTVVVECSQNPCYTRSPRYPKRFEAGCKLLTLAHEGIELKFIN
jgi:hypothetical protein